MHRLKAPAFSFVQGDILDAPLLDRVFGDTAFDVIVHLMRADVRQRYDLEGLWGDAARLRARAKPKSKAKSKR
jgi:nucleoside-diphosphate-sugar epimerase